MNALQRSWRWADDLLARVQASAPPPAKLDPLDLLCGLLAAMAGVAVAWWGAGVIGDSLYTEGSFNVWFQADNPRVFANLLDSASSQYRATVHPAFPILFTPWLSLFTRLGASPLLVAKAVLLACAGLSTGGMFAVLRLLSLPRLAAAAFTAVFVASAGFLHWYTALECAPFAGLSIVLALLLLVRPTRNPVWAVLISAFTLSVTITNWSIGLAATIARYRLTPAVRISVAALALVVGLSVVQHLVYRSANFFFSPTGLLREKTYVGPENKVWSPGENVRDLIVYTAVAPSPTVAPFGPDRVVTNQAQPMTSAGPLGLAAMIGWIALLAAGLWGMARERSRAAISLGVGLMVAGQLVLGALYGDVSFLYATNILPQLVLLAAFAWFTPVRWLAAALALAVAIAGGYSNARQFQAAAAFARQIVDTGGNREDPNFLGERMILPRRGQGATTP